jgi:hypothetical protein
MHPLDATVSARFLSVGGGPNIPLSRPFLGKATGLAFLLAEFRRLCYIASQRVDRGGIGHDRPGPIGNRSGRELRHDLGEAAVVRGLPVI